MIPEHIQKLVNEGKVKIASEQETIDGHASFVLSSVAEQIEEGKIKVADIHFDNMKNNENECFIFARFEFIE